jgi:hypothetical protein
VDQERLARECNDLPIFPLGGAVLLPGAVMPLHVFEERYRRMLDDVVAGTGLMGIATVTEPSADGSPDPVHGVVGVGMVVAHQRLPDGRSHILLQHVGTVRIQQELEVDGPYRRVHGELVGPGEAQVGSEVAALRMMVLQLGTASPGAAEEAARVAELKGTEFLDGLARRVLPAVEQRLAYLGAGTWSERVAVLEEAVVGYMSVVMPAADEA